MTIEVKVPMLPESIADATIATWHKKEGDRVSRDENLVDLETDKVMLEVPAPADGIIKQILKPTGETVKANQVIAIIEAGKGAALDKSESANKTVSETPASAEKSVESASGKEASSLSPSARRAVAEHDVDVTQVKGTGKDGRITKENVVQ